MAVQLREARKLLLLSGFLALLLIMDGCSTTMTSKRLPPKTEQTASDPNAAVGIIFQMTKPEFTILTTRPTEPSAEPKYTLNMELVADPERRFAVSVDPGIFKEADITVNLSDKGVMTGITQDSRDLVAPTIKAIGEFTLSVIGAAATIAGTAAARLMAVSPADEGEKAPSPFPTPNECQELLTPVSQVKLPEANQPPAILMSKELTERIDKFSKPSLSKKRAEAAKNIKDKIESVKSKLDKPEAMSYLDKALKTTDPTEIGVLKEIAHMNKVEPPSEKDYIRLLDVIDSEQLRKKSGPLKISAPEEITDSAKKEVFILVKREEALVGGEVEYAKQNEDLSLLRIYSSRQIDKKAEGSLSKDQKKILGKGSDCLAMFATRAVLDTTTFPKLLGPYIKEKTRAQQIYEKAKECQGKIADFQAKLVLSEDCTKDEKQGPKTDKKKREECQALIDLWTDKFHEIIGAGLEYAEILKLRKIITKGPPASAAKPLEEYATARAQLASLNDAVTLKLGKIASDAAETPPAKKAEWNPTPVDRAFCWNEPREKWEGKKDPPKRILVQKNIEKSEDPPADPRVASRVATQYGADPGSWPQFVVLIEEEVKP